MTAAQPPHIEPPFFAFDDFEDGDLVNWDTLGFGGWRIDDGMVRPITPGGTHRLALKEDAATNIPTHLTWEFEYIAHALVGTTLGLQVEPRMYANMDRIQVRFLSDRAALRHVDGSTSALTELATNDAIDTTLGQRYRVRISYQGQRLRVHRRAIGSGDDKWKFVFDNSNLLPDPPQNVRIAFVQGNNVDISLDNIRVQSAPNFDQFLHLAPDSPCIDVGLTELVDDPTTPEVEMDPNKPVPFKDFSDQPGPLDGMDADEPQFIPERDIGADEWPQPAEVAYWWESL